MGGIARRATSINNIREQGIQTILLDGGEFASELSELGRIKFETLLESFLQLQYDAISFGEREMLMQNEGYDACGVLNSSGIPIITLNILHKGKRFRENPLIIDRGGIKVGIFGLLLKHNIPGVLRKDWVIEDPEKVIEGALSFSRNNADFVVAILHGDVSLVRDFVKKHGGMDIVIVSGNTGEDPSHLKIDNCLLVSAGKRGRYLGRIDASFYNRKWQFNDQTVALDKYVPKDPMLTATYEGFQERVKWMTRKGAKKIEGEVRARFSSLLCSVTCMTCHGDIYDAWDKTAHAHAIDSLISKNEQYNPECVACHTTGYLEGGFVSMETTPQYAGVQCVSCHGRMEGHIGLHSGMKAQLQADAATGAEVIKDICVKCHTVERDDDFDFERDKKKVH